MRVVTKSFIRTAPGYITPRTKTLLSVIKTEYAGKSDARKMTIVAVANENAALEKINKEDPILSRYNDIVRDR